MSLISPCRKDTYLSISLSICTWPSSNKEMKCIFFLNNVLPPHTILSEAGSCREFTERFLVTLKAEGYKRLEMNENTTVYPEQNTHFLGRQMLHPNHVHWEHGSFMHCGTVTLFSSLSNFFLATCTQAMGKPWDILIAPICKVEAHLVRLWGHCSSSLARYFPWLVCSKVLAVFSRIALQFCIV